MLLILVVDGDEATLESLCELLVYEGYSCAQASTGHQALRILIDRRPALVIAGEDFADMDAVTFLMAKAAVATVSQTPVIVTTADPRLRQLSGAVALLVKPYGVSELLRLIRDHLPPDHEPVAA